MQTTSQRVLTEIPASDILLEQDIRKQELRVAAYCRVSTQSDEQTNSYESQINYYTNLINENPNWKLVGIFADKGLSGTTTKKREQFNLMIQKCRRGRIDLIITKSVSRFSRNTMDCIGFVRKLKEMNIGVFFEKEGVNTMDMDDEMLLTIFGVLAQTESQSLSKNISMGYRQAFKAGKVPYHSLYGYERGEDGNYKIKPDEAQIVQRIYHRYLSGQSVGQIRKDLQEDGILTKSGKPTWSEGVLQHTLRNERYAGDVLLQKTCVKDVLNHKSEKNTGKLPQYYIHNNHTPIIDRDVWNKVQEEIARRVSKRKEPSKNARTSTSKYCGKYALNELLVCGECGALYRRTTWAKRPHGRVAVWRCTSRLEHGIKYCKHSPTLPEESLHRALMSAISEVITRDALVDALTDSVRAAACAETDAAKYQSAKRRIEELDKMWDSLLKQSAKAEYDEDFFDNKIKDIMAERSKWQKTVDEFETKDSIDRYTERKVNEAIGIFSQAPTQLTQYDEQVIRQLIDKIQVLEEDRIMVTLKGGMEIEQYIER